MGLGLGLQKIASNYVSGYIILLDRSVRIGDLVTVDNRHGVVKEIASRYTVIRSLDGTESIMPNETLITQAVTNHSFTDRKVLVKVKVSVGYGSDIDRVFALLLDIARRQPRVLADPAPACSITALGRQRHRRRAGAPGSRTRTRARRRCAGRSSRRSWRPSVPRASRFPSRSARSAFPVRRPPR